VQAADRDISGEWDLAVHWTVDEGLAGPAADRADAFDSCYTGVCNQHAEQTTKVQENGIL
jgi:hypothetical protein